ncbi:beta-lactamase-like protein [Rubellimicrobium mesophilum DSM 19309]|uniref:Beta-lactamase-like protein n=1 Tax=Rubellimicrobium mesophilum DSM 19309 TaxID=442562 RepID=A0A017HTV5_9RHOB|nr:MBL fold metallo-hydrolase [Rubellimicrobium mesophilum]EYD77179.1 beta-lactamase-like protein [Rubellimicrobium mesophilum DSM 19309]
MIADLASVRWIHGAPDCAQSDDPLIQVIEADPDTYVLRISKCFSFEANFIYFLLGAERAILFDTGGPADSGNRALPLRDTVDAVLNAHPRGDSLELIVAHTHGHRDHIHWDFQFRDRPDTSLVGLTLEDVKAFWRLPDWPEGVATLDLLGGRPLTVFPIPGHEPTHIAVFDPRTGILLTGDVLYPGLLTVRDWPAFRASARRLSRFAATHPVHMALGHHIEMSRTPGRLYPLGATWQPDEHPLPLEPSVIDHLHRACEAMADAPHSATFDTFAIEIMPEAEASLRGAW